MGLLDGKVALVTGAGGGLGRAYALLLAKEGAKVVVNDLGGARDGSGAGASMADKVVDELRALGGEAVANHGSVADAASAAAMVEDAFKRFGRLDIVINNAGILRDKTLAKMTEAEWDVVIQVHLKGTFLVTQAAVAKLREQGQGGRVVNTSSLAGLIGNFGQANYGAAKAGIAGFTRVVALETRKAGITVNAIAPVAKTRMTEEIAAVPDDFQPDTIAPLVVWLCTDEAKEVTGRVFGAHGRHYFEYLTEMTPGVERPEPWSVADVGARFADIARPAKAEPPATAAAAASSAAAAAVAAATAAPSLDALVDQAFARMGEAFVAEKAAGWASVLHFKVGPSLAYTVEVKDQQVTTQRGSAGTPKCTISFDSAETFLGTVSGKVKAQSAFMAGQIKADEMGELMRYAQCFDMRRAAAAAASATTAKAAEPSAPSAPEPAQGLNRALLGKRYKVPAVFVRPEEIRAYADATEDHNPAYDAAEGAIAPPLFPVRPLWEAVQAVVFDEGLRVDMLRLVHGEQEMIFHRHLRPWDLVAPRAEVLGIEDKASGQILKVRQVLMCDGELVNETISAYFIRSPQKAAQGAKKEAAPPAPAPTREVIFEGVQRVAEDQPLRYGPASGDINPIHMDHDVARAAGHPSIILHGLCTMAFASKAVVEGVCGGDPNRLKRLFARFSRPVLPGWTLTTRVWSEGERDGLKLYGFETTNQDGVPVLLQGRAEAL